VVALMRESTVAKAAAARRRQRVIDTQNWRARQRRSAVVLPVEADAATFDLMARLGLLAPVDATNRRVVAFAFGKLLRLALAALRRELDSR
jgi:hypothetical protein